MTGTASKRSKLLPVGVLLPFPVQTVGRSLDPGLVSGVLLIVSDLLRLLFFAGVACAIIGLLRNRRAKREEAQSRTD